MSQTNTIESIEEAIDEFEQPWSEASRDRIGELLARHGLAGDKEALTELLRIDVEMRNKHNLDFELDDYISRFESLLGQVDRIVEIAFEDFRSRRVYGRPVLPSRWQHLPGVSQTAWFGQLATGTDGSSIVGLPQSDVAATRGSTDPLDNLADFDTGICNAELASDLAAIGFRPITKIGEGAFSEVFLATQDHLANRYVVLKVVDEPLDEAKRMASLQHANIVPIFSFHRAADRWVICMPFAGNTTLRDYLGDASAKDERDGNSLVSTIAKRSEPTQVNSCSADSDDLSVATGLPVPLDANLPPVATPLEGVPATVSDRFEQTADANPRRLELSAGPLETVKSLDRNQLASWLFGRIAAGLAHAHARGVMHGDIKPGNVLIRDDGEPGLLDFNLSHEVASADRARVGGTLPYMSPETIEAMMGFDVTPGFQSDIYGLGVMMYEFLTGRSPFPKPESTTQADLGEALQARQKPIVWESPDLVSPDLVWSDQVSSGQVPPGQVPPAQVAVSQVSPGQISLGLRAIVEKCLAFEPENRYPDSDSLQRDLDRQRRGESLLCAEEPWSSRVRKWLARHPKGTSTAMAIALVVALAIPSVVIAVRWRTAYLESDAAAMAAAFERDSVETLSALMADPMLRDQASLERAMKPLVDYQVLDPPGSEITNGRWLAKADQQAFRNAMFRHVCQVGFLQTSRLRGQGKHGKPSAQSVREFEVLVEAAKRIARSQPNQSSSRATAFLEAHLARFSSDAPEAKQRFAVARSTPMANDTEVFLEAARLMSQDRWAEARPLLTKLADRESIPPSLRWTGLGRVQFAQRHYEDAALSFTQSIERVPESSRLWMLRGLCYLQQGRGQRAEKDFDQAIQLDPGNYKAWTNRGLVRFEQDDFENAIADFTAGIKHAPDAGHLMLLRSRAYRSLGDQAAAKRDFDAVMAASDLSAPSLVSRAMARENDDPEGALEDLQAASKLDPDSEVTLFKTAHLLSRTFGRNEEALEILDRLLEAQPRSERFLSDRAVLLSYLGRFDEARTCVDEFLTGPNEPRSYYQAACAYSRMPSMGDHIKALKYLSLALQAGYPADRLESDSDLDPIRKMRGFQAISRTYQLGQMAGRESPRNSGNDGL